MRSERTKVNVSIQTFEHSKNTYLMVGYVPHRLEILTKSTFVTYFQSDLRSEQKLAPRSKNGKQQEEKAFFCVTFTL